MNELQLITRQLEIQLAVFKACESLTERNIKLTKPLIFIEISNLNYSYSQAQVETVIDSLKKQGYLQPTVKSSNFLKVPNSKDSNPLVKSLIRLSRRLFN